MVNGHDDTTGLAWASATRDPSPGRYRRPRMSVVD
jgi:hypothetical protein